MVAKEEFRNEWTVTINLPKSSAAQHSELKARQETVTIRDTIVHRVHTVVVVVEALEFD